MIETILKKSESSPLNQAEIVTLLSAEGSDLELLFDTAAEVKARYVGQNVYLRGLIEYSNKCIKNCKYCGVRRGNSHVIRYEMSHDEVIEVAKYAQRRKFGSLVIQSGERTDQKFVSTISSLLQEIRTLSNGELHVTLSVGEQTEEVYKTWVDAGAHRFLLRIEATNRALYEQIHPVDATHDFDKRIAAIHALRRAGFQVGTGVMIGLPNQTLEDLAGDLLFMQQIDIDMCGMGPYIEHEETPLYAQKELLMPLQERFNLSLKMVAILRILMKNINIAATTAMQAIDDEGREKAIRCGANVVMPNLTPLKYREEYFLYNNKPGVADDADTGLDVMKKNIEAAGCRIAFGEWGDSEHYNARTTN